MLTKAEVLKYIKQNLAFPWQALELSDDDIINYITDFTIKNFSYFWPDKNKMAFNATNDNRHNNVPNEYYITDPDDMPILYLLEIVDSSSVVSAGHPIVGLSGSEPERYVYKIEKLSPQFRWGWQRFEYEFIHPNIIRLSGLYPNNMVVEYARVHNPDFHTINIHQQKYFLPYCLAEIKIWLGSLRKKYSSLTTPYGDIPISADLYDEGKTEKSDLEEKLRVRNLDVVISRG